MLPPTKSLLTVSIFLFFPGMVNWSAPKKFVASWEAIFTLGHFTIPKEKARVYSQIKSSSKMPDHRAFNQHMLVQHNGEQSAKHFYIEMHRTVGTFSSGFKHTNDNAVRELFIYFRKSSVGTCYIEENRKNLLCSTMLTCR